MIKANNITFYKLMTAGYISEKTYQFVVPKERLYELNESEINSYKYKYKSELLPLIKDVDTYLTIAYMEKLETQLMEGDDTPFELLNDCICKFPVKMEHLINEIGKKKFLQDYVYCTVDTLKKRSLISNENIKTVISFRTIFRSLFQLYCGGLDANKCKSFIAKLHWPVQTETTPDSPIETGVGFNSTEIVSIDDDRVSISNKDYRKYVLFLYSLNKDLLDVIIVYLISVLRTVSVRTRNVIKYLGYREFLVNYLFADPEKLLNLRNVGKKSLIELNTIRPTIINYIKELYLSGYTAAIEDTLKQEEGVLVKNRTLKEQIGQNRYKFVTDLLTKLLKDVSVRSRNGILAYNGDFIEDFVNNSNDIKSLKNIGSKSELEISLVIKKIRECVATLIGRELSEDELFILELQASYDKYFDEFAHRFYSDNGHLPMFYILEKFFRSLLETSRNFQIYNLRTPMFTDVNSLSLEEIADEYSLTRESVRQIHMKIRKHLYQVDDTYKDKKELSLAKIISNSNDWSYVIDELLTNNYIDSSMLSGYCAQENHHFTDDFMLFIVGAIAKQSFVPIGKPILPYPTKSTTEWNNCYLVKKELADKFDFVRFFDLIEEYKDSNTEVLEASAREMILDTFLSAWIFFDSSLVDDISDVINNIIIQELEIIPDDNFRFTIEGKKPKNLADFIYDVLKSHGNPLSFSELFNSIDNQYPNKYKSPASIRAIVMRDPRICSVGFKNMVALVEWDHIKIGSIRSIIVQFLEKFNEPQQVKDIVKYVQRYRDSSDNSIRSTLGSGEQFVQFRGGKYGLKWKTYCPDYLDESEIIFIQHIQELENFLQTNKHFPCSPSNPKEERLYRWWYRTKGSKSLKKSQQTQVKRIIETYKAYPVGKRQSEWYRLCNEYKSFVTQKGRRPSQYSSHETVLFQWFNRAKKDFSDGRLKSYQEKEFLELCKSL